MSMLQYIYVYFMIMIGPQIYSNIYRYNSFKKNEKKNFTSISRDSTEKSICCTNVSTEWLSNLIWITVELGKISKNNFIRGFIWNR